MNNEYQICEEEGIIKVLMFTPHREQAHWVLVSLDKFDKLMMSNNWTLTKNLYPRGYALVDGVYREVKLHRFLTDCPAHLVTDHIDGNTLNNLNSNLRTTSQQHNNQNSSIRKDNTTGYKGVSKRGD